jgi:hypothetical protein
MLFARSFILSLLFFPAYLLAAQDIQVVSNNNATVELRLMASKVKLAQALNQIAKETGIPVHYSMLPDQPITADCTGKIKTILACLLGTNVDRVYRYASGASKDQQQDQPVEVWILEIPASLNQFKAGNALAGNLEKKQGQQTTTERQKVDNTELFMEQVKDPKQRMEAIANLAMACRKDDLNVRTVLKDALTDKNPGVRLQAVLAIAGRDGVDSLADMQRAMLDENADVRRMAVERVGNNYLLLEQALKDIDPNIRQYAKTKLALLNKANYDN